jgi:3-dehydrosphinganine reductase
MFKNQRIVITGGSSGLGLALAHALARDSARLTLVARDRNKLDAAASAVQRAVPGTSIQVESINVADEAQVATAMERIAQSGGGIDVLINSAGILREGYFETLPMSAFREVMETNFFGLLNATRAALPYLRTSHGRLVNIASVAGLAGVFGYTSYCSSKHALVGLTESLRFELLPQGIRVHLVCPAEFDSPMVDELDTYRTPENRAQVQTIPKSSVDTIVKDTLAGIRAERFLIVPGATARVAAFGLRHFPGFFRANGDRTVRKVYRGPPQ